MTPQIDGTSFGSITIDGVLFEHDVIIATNGAITKRKKKLSKAVYGSSHTLSLQEAEYVIGHGPNAERLIVGSGQYGNVHLSREASAYLEGRRCEVVLMPTPEAIKAWNAAAGRSIGLFHVTC